MEFSNELKKATLKTAFHYLEKNPEENIHRIMAAIDKFAGDGPDSFPTQREAFRNVLENPDNNMYQLIMSVLKDIDKEVVKVSLENFFFNANIVGWPIQEKTGRNMVAIFRGLFCWILLRHVISIAQGAGPLSMEIN